MKNMESENILKKGDLFGIKLGNIEKLSIVETENDNFNYSFNSKTFISDKLKNQYILCIYLGDGLAREYYTSTIFNVVGIDNVNVLKTLDNYEEFEKNYNRAVRYPLSLSVNEETKLYLVDGSYYKMLSKNQKVENEIKMSLKSTEKIAREDLTNKYNEIVSNKSYNLKKTY